MPGPTGRGQMKLLELSLLPDRLGKQKYTASQESVEACLRTFPADAAIAAKPQQVSLLIPTSSTVITAVDA